MPTGHGASGIHARPPTGSSAGPVRCRRSEAAIWSQGVRYDRGVAESFPIDRRECSFRRSRTFFSANLAGVTLICSTWWLPSARILSRARVSPIRSWFPTSPDDSRRSGSTCATMLTASFRVVIISSFSSCGWSQAKMVEPPGFPGRFRRDNILHNRRHADTALSQTMNTRDASPHTAPDSPPATPGAGFNGHRRIERRGKQRYRSFHGVLRGSVVRFGLTP